MFLFLLLSISEEAENERMHLLTALQLKEPSLVFRLAVIGAQGIEKRKRGRVRASERGQTDVHRYTVGIERKEKREGGSGF